MVNSSFPSGGALQKKPWSDMKTTIAATLMFRAGRIKKRVRFELVKETLTNSA
jgi:hypothetical protein